MTAKSKAKELFKKYSKGKDEHGWYLCEFNSCAKNCALIAVDEIINSVENEHVSEIFENYWIKVKKEINKL